jgi:mannose-6-phosphate isomerase
MRELLRFHPIYQERVWGGEGLHAELGRDLPEGKRVGESWEIVDRPEAQSVVIGGVHDGRTFRELFAIGGADLMGPSWPAEKPFPILVKWLDCRERLSLQVHPPQRVAAELRGEPKTENWFIAHTEPGAELIVGLRRGVTRAQFEDSANKNALEACVHRFPVAEGDSILVHSGQVHAIGAGNLILEIQQNSDTTYRVYDWGRVGLDGKPRQMHLEQSLRSIDWEDFEPVPVRATPTSGVIADCAEFRIRRVVLAPGDRLNFTPGDQPRLISVVSGAVDVANDLTDGAPQKLTRGDNALMPYAGAFTVTSGNTAIVLITEKFA